MVVSKPQALVCLDLAIQGPVEALRHSLLGVLGECVSGIGRAKVDRGA